MSELLTLAETKALDAANYHAFRGIDLRQIKSRVAEMVTQIGKHGIFDQYTRHDISHINQVLKSLTDWIIPKSTAEKMKPGDWLMIVLSVYFHDLGMVVTKDEYDNRNLSGFEAYKQWIRDNSSAEFLDKISKFNDDKFLYQEFVRSNHAHRVKNWLVGINDTRLGRADAIVEEISKLFINLDEEFRIDLGKICESHHEDDLDNFSKYEIEKFYGNDPNEHVNLHYCAILLRTADLLHITSDRTPSVEYRLINPSDPISQDEWAKQLAVKNVGPKKMRNEEGDIDLTTQSNTVEITATFKGEVGANGFFGLTSYITYARNELKKNFDWTQRAIKSEGSRYEFPWNRIDDSKLRTEGFEPKLFEFNLDQNKILRLLVGHTLYNDSTVVIRELVQNSIDAIKLQNYVLKKDLNQELQGKIVIKWDTKARVLSFMDNGTGMTQEIIEEHLLKVGSSRYQSDSFRKNFPGFTPISRFGIGILTCFLVADNVEIITSHIDEPKAKKLTIRNVNGKYLLQHLEKHELESQIRHHGTLIKLEIRANVDLSDLLNQINRWIVFPPCSVVLKIDEEDDITIGFNTPKEAMEHHLKTDGYEIDNINIKVEESSLNGVTIAYGLKFNSYYKEWSMMRSHYDRTDEINGLGTCIEGIRVEFNSPGYSDKGILAIANASGVNAPTTNVARSNIEATSSGSNYLKSIYSLYINHLKGEVQNLQDQHAFSISWVAGEIRYLLEPIIGSRYGRNMASIEDEKLFYTELDTANLILVEKDNKRGLVTIDSLDERDELWVVDSNLFQSVETLLREIKGSTSLLNLIKTLSSDYDHNTTHLKTLLCSYSQNDSLQNRILENRTIGDIKIFPVDRRVDVCWSKSKRYWDAVLNVSEIESEYRGSSGTLRSFFIQLDSYDIDSEGIASVSIIACFNLVFILKGSPIWNYLSKLYHALNLKSNEEELAAFGFLLGFTHNLFHLDYDNSSVSAHEINTKLNILQEQHGHISREMWQKLNRSEFISALSSTTWNVFTPAAWNRSIFSILGASQY